ncbi:MAG: phosphatase [Chloroflexi bacterium RBG_16_56_11]|nr:MAG: phosphatase [Chloroflexi bacterium RBG_16_56_11]
MSRVDLHVHSTASDGKYRPEDIVRKAADLNIEVLSITDHDSTDGILPARQAARAFPGLRFIPGVEISTDIPEGEAHILGYFVDYASYKFKAALKKFRESRVGRARGMITKLAGLGIDIDWRRVQEIAGDGAIGRPHIARAMLEKGYIKSFEEAFDKYIGHGCPAYVEREKMTPAEAVALVVRSRGVPVLAHPFTVGGDPEAMVIELKKAGLAGIEAYYKENTGEQTAAMLAMADKYGLIATGGSDFHGIEDSRDAMMGSVDVPIEAAESLFELADRSR